MEGRINIVQNDVLEVCLGENSWRDIEVHRPSKGITSVTVPELASYRLVMGIVCAALHDRHVVLCLQELMINTEALYRQAKTAAGSRKLQLQAGWARPGHKT